MKVTTRRLRHDRRGVSNVIVVMLSLVLLVIIVANVILWSYQMSQLDWERGQEHISLEEVSHASNSSWFTSQNEYAVDAGSRINGTYGGTQANNDGSWETFQQDPSSTTSTIGTSTGVYSTQYPDQRKTFYTKGLFWVFYSDGSNLVYRTSSDGLSWSSSNIVRSPCQLGYYFSVWFDGDYVHYAYSRGFTGEALLYRRGLPNADGTITWSTPEQQATEAVPTRIMYRRQTWVEGNLWSMDSSPSPTVNYTTEIVTGTTSAGNFYYANPFLNHTVSNGTALPSNILLQGWRTPGTTNLKESRYLIYGVARNREGSTHSGRMHARLWKSQYSNMSSAVAVSTWNSAPVSFAAIAGQEVPFLISIYVTDSPNNEYFYVEFAWEISTPATSNTAGLYFRAESSSYVYQYGWAYNSPNIAMGSDGYPFVTYRRYNYYNSPFVTKSSFNDGSWTTAPGFPYQLQAASSNSWMPTALPLTDGKVYALYTDRYTTYGRLWNGSNWEPEEIITTTDLQQPQYYSAIADGDDVHLAFLTVSPYNISYRKRVYGSGWNPESTIQAGVTSTSAPVLSIDSEYHDLYCFWAGKNQYVDVTNEKAANKSLVFTPLNDGYTYQNVVYVNETVSATSPLLGSRGNDVGVWVGLPWSVNYYGANKSRIYVCSNGFGVFDIAYNGNSNSLTEMQSRKMIAPFWDDLRTDANPDDGIYAENKTDRVVIHWRATRIGASSDRIEMQLIIFQNGTIQFNWNDIVNLGNFSPTCGLGNTKDHVYAMKNIGGVWDTYATDWIDESNALLTGNDRLTCFYQALENRIGLGYQTGVSAPYGIEYGFLDFTQPRLALNGNFSIDTITYPLTYVHGFEIQLVFRSNYTGERLFLKALNWTSMTYSDVGFNFTTGQTPTEDWRSYVVRITDSWRSYVRDDGALSIEIHDQGRDINQTTIDSDFLGVRALINGSTFAVRNDGPGTAHLVSIWMLDSVHTRYSADIFVNSGQETVIVRADIQMPLGDFVSKVVTEKGNIAVFSSG